MLHAPLKKQKIPVSACHSVAKPVSIQCNCKSSTQNPPKLAFLSSKIANFSGEGAQPSQTSPQWEGDTTYPLGASATRSSRLRRSTVTPSALVPQSPTQIAATGAL